MKKSEYVMIFHLVDEIKICPSDLFSMQLEELEHLADQVQLLIYTRYFHSDNIDFLF